MHLQHPFTLVELRTRKLSVAQISNAIPQIIVRIPQLFEATIMH